MKRRKDKEPTPPLTRGAVEECAEAMRIAKESKEKLDMIGTCFHCSGIFEKEAMFPIWEIPVYDFVWTRGEPILICVNCAQDEKAVLGCQDRLRSIPGHPLPERRIEERRGRPRNSKRVDNAHAIIDKTRVRKGEAE